MGCLEEQGTRRGERPQGRLITGPASTRLRVDRSLEVEAPLVWTTGREIRPSTADANGKGAAAADEAEGAARREKPLNGHMSWTRLGDETSPGAGVRSKPSRGCERLWTERSRALGAPADVDAPGDVAKRAETLADPPVRKDAGRGVCEGALKRRHDVEG